MSTRVFSSDADAKRFVVFSEKAHQGGASLELKLAKIEYFYQHSYRPLEDLLQESPPRWYFRDRHFDESDINVLMRSTTLQELAFSDCSITENGAIALVRALESGNVYALAATEMLLVKHHIGQQAYRVLQRFIGDGNYSLRWVKFNNGGAMEPYLEMRLQDALRVRESWGKIQI